MQSEDGATRMVPIVLVEDILLLGDGIASMLRAQGLRVVAAIRSGEDALRQILRLQPRVVLLDSAVGKDDGPRLVEAVRRQGPEVRVVVKDLEPVRDSVIEFVRAGASGFILKDATIDVVVATIRSVANGLCVLPPRLASVLFSYLDEPLPRAPHEVRAAKRLTPREVQVTELIAVGLSNKEIAGDLDIALHTVKSHVHSVLEKLGLRTRLQLAVYTHAEVRSPR